MKTYKMTVRIDVDAANNKSLIPDFGLGVGVLEIQKLGWCPEKLSDETENSPAFKEHLLEIAEQLINKWLVVDIEKIEDDEQL